MKENLSKKIVFSNFCGNPIVSLSPVRILLGGTFYTGHSTGGIVAYTNDPYVLREIIQNNSE